MIPFDLDRIECETFVRRVVYFGETTSTNNIALELAERDEAPYPFLVLAARQTAGRGRGANRWWSSEGALTFSLALDAAPIQASPERRPLISLAAGLAVCETVAELLPRQLVGVKWPNDVQVDGRKICGILVESAQRGQRLVIGVGLNVNNPLAEAPEELARHAATLVDAAGRMFSLSEVLVRLLQRFAQEWELFLAGDDQLIERLRRCCVLSGRHVVVQAGEESVAGLCRGLADDGALLVETPAGPRRLYAGVAVASTDV